MRVDNGRGTTRENNLRGAGFPCHVDNLARRGSSNDGVIYQTNNLTTEFRFHGAQFTTDALLARLLTGQDEGPVNVSVLDKAIGERLAQFLRDNSCCSAGRFGHGDDDVNLVQSILPKNLLDLVGEFGAHILPAAVD